MSIIWEAFENISERGSAVLAVLTNALLLFLIINEALKTLGSYKYLLIFICLFEIQYSMINAIFLPVIFTDDSSYFIVVDSRKTLIPNQFMVVCSVIYCYFYGVSMAVCSILFIFRSFAISGNKKWIQNKPHIIISWIAPSILFGMLWALIVWFFCGPSDVNDRYLQSKFLDPIGSKIDQVGYTGLNFYLIENGVSTYNWRNFIGLFLMTIFIFTSSSLMFFFGNKCYNSITHLTLASTSSYNRNLQQQLFYALVFQNAIPICLMHIPGGLVLLTTLFSSSSPIFGRITAVTVAMYPAIDPLPNIIIITPYRQAVWRYLRCKKKTAQSSTIANVLEIT